MKAATAVFVLLLGLLVAPVMAVAQYDQSAPPPPGQQYPEQYPESAPPEGQAPPVQATPMTPDQLQQLVAPIALYPDSLVAQILAASTYPTQIVEAERWLEANQGPQGQALADAVNQQPWDPSVKALTQFPSVLANMNQNLSWTQSLGDAYYNQPQDVMNAIQVMRQKAEAAGNLRTTQQQVVTSNGPDIVIQPANPTYVYVPIYDPWVVYGPPLPIWPGFVFGPVWVGRPYFGFGFGINIGFFSGFGWGWPHWGFDWRAHQIFYNRAPWVPRGPAFFNHRYYAPMYRGGVARGAEPRGGQVGRGAEPYRGEQVGRGAEPYRGEAGRGAEPYRGAAPAPAYRPVAPHPVEPPVGRGFGEPHGTTGVRSGAFSGYAHGGVTNGYAARGERSMGGGGGGHGGGRR
jgi:Protein of unknown function (DUF3300)